MLRNSATNLPDRSRSLVPQEKVNVALCNQTDKLRSDFSRFRYRDSGKPKFLFRRQDIGDKVVRRHYHRIDYETLLIFLTHRIRHQAILQNKTIRCLGKVHLHRIFLQRRCHHRQGRHLAWDRSRPSLHLWTLNCAAIQPHVAKVCHFKLVCTFEIHVNTWITTHLPIPKGWKAELAWGNKL